MNMECNRESDRSLPPFTIFKVIDLEMAHQKWLMLLINMKAEALELQAK